MLDCLAKIMETFVDKRSKNATIKRMIELGLIAERSEILPSKRKRSRKSQPNAEGDSDDSGSGSNSSDSDDDDDVHDSRPVRVTIKNTKKPNAKSAKPKQQPVREIPKITLNVTDIQKQIAEMNDDLKTHFEWLQESLNDAAEDTNDNDDLSDPSDGVPLVPFSMSQKEALANPQFKKLLQTLGLQEPLKEMVNIFRFVYF